MGFFGAPLDSDKMLRDTLEWIIVDVLRQMWKMKSEMAKSIRKELEGREEQTEKLLRVD